MGFKHPHAPDEGWRGARKAEPLKSVLEAAAPEGGGGGGSGGRGLVSDYALLGLVLGQSLLVLKPHSTGVLPLGLNTKCASETSLVI